jgi:hypothetical protein
LVLDMCCPFAVAAADLCGCMGLGRWFSVSWHDQVQQEGDNGADTEPYSSTFGTWCTGPLTVKAPLVTQLWRGDQSQL